MIQLMKAVICKQYGPPETLELKMVPVPEPKEHEVLVKIEATAVNSGDVRVRGLAVEGIMKWIMRLVMGFNKPRKPILGTVFAGTIHRVGSKVTKFQTGQKVFGMTGFDFGTYAEYLCIGENKNILEMPHNASFEEAAAIIFGGQTAIYFLNKAQIAHLSIPKILILGASGSVGTSALQIARHFKADCTAMCSSVGLDLMLKLGVKNIINYDLTSLKNIDQQFDIVFDAVGKYKKLQCQHLLRENGKFLTVGGMDYAKETIDQLQTLKTLFESGELHAVINRVYSFDQIVEAHRYVDSGRKKGNVVLVPNISEK